MFKDLVSVFLMSAFLFAGAINAQLSIQAIDVSGDSISKGYNAGNSFPCSNSDQENYNWLTSNTSGANLCSAGSEGVFSIRERLQCASGLGILARTPNSAASGATLLNNFSTQAANVRTYLEAQSGNRLAAVFLGHNDNCSGTLAKTNASCSSTDLDPANHCRTRDDAFEREFRKGLDILITISNTRVGVVAPVRVSQLCNFGTKSNCQLGGNCTFLWGSVNICGSLTRGCSNTQIIDAYNTMRSYRQILKRVTEEYAAIPNGGSSPVVMIGGQMVGGATKAFGVDVMYSDAPWFYKFSANQLSCCDCFHPAGAGQNTLARLLNTGLTCSRLNPCCRDTGDPLVDGRCAQTERKMAYYRGLF
jgi:hypothetical protein